MMRLLVGAMPARAEGSLAVARISPTLLWAALAVVAVALYSLGLGGGFEFDDYPNIVDNRAVQVTTLEPARWLEAIQSSPASDLRRPLAFLSFAVDHYVAGLDPRVMKGVNIGLHVLNGWLLFLLIRMLAPYAASNEERLSHEQAGLLAACVSGIWLLHPINLTSVLYVVQRMESLSNLFVLAGLMLYAGARIRQAQDRKGSAWRLWIGVPMCTLVGLGAKETALLLPLYAWLLEVCVFRRGIGARNSLRTYFVILLWIPGTIASAWMLSRALAPESYAFREFTLIERMLTEPRVLMDYARWILFPLPGSFSFFRDSYAVSTSLLQPWSTIPAILAVIGAIAGAFALRHARPLLALGVLVFFAAHAMTATFIPLELVFEHRNYFASAGLILAICELALRPLRNHDRKFQGLVLVIPLLALVSAGTLFVRAKDWGNPLRLAHAEASLNPTSPRAAFNLGRTYFNLAVATREPSLVARAFETLRRAAALPRSGILPEAGLIILASRTGRAIEDAWWVNMQSKLRQRPSMVEDAAALRNLMQCRRDGACKLDTEQMAHTFIAARKSGKPLPAVLYSFAIFAYNDLKDPDLALQLATEAARASRDPQYQINLAGLLIDLGRLDEAAAEIRSLERRLSVGEHRSDVAELNERLKQGNSGKLH